MNFLKVFITILALFLVSCVESKDDSTNGNRVDNDSTTDSM